MRSTLVGYFVLAFLIGIGTAAATECPPGALGVSRTLAIDPNEHARVGSMQYPESLPLNDHEVVLTFDDGPVPSYTSRILETLASECVKATFFMVGRMARTYPSLVRRVYNEGHTVANHSQNHPFTFNKMTVAQAARSISLERWADWGESERLVVNVSNIYAELEHDLEPLNPVVAFEQMAELARSR